MAAAPMSSPSPLISVSGVMDWRRNKIAEELLYFKGEEFTHICTPTGLHWFMCLNHVVSDVINRINIYFLTLSLVSTVALLTHFQVEGFSKIPGTGLATSCHLQSDCEQGLRFMLSLVVRYVAVMVKVSVHVQKHSHTFAGVWSVRERYLGFHRACFFGCRCRTCRRRRRRK